MQYLEKALTFVVHQSLHLDILLKSKPYSNKSLGFKVYYFGTSFLLAFIGLFFISITEVLLIKVLLTFVFLAAITFNIYIYDSISANRKISIGDKFIIRPAVLRIRNQSIKNFGFKFSEEQIRKIFAQLLEYKFISKNTSLDSFRAVFMFDFGHKDQVQWNTTLSQTNLILNVFKRYSNDFEPSLAIRKKLFLSKDGTEINIGSYNNAKKYRSKKNEELFFKDDFEQFDDFMRYLIDKNDEK